jgi:hypothetical protein
MMTVVAFLADTSAFAAVLMLLSVESCSLQ